jgi:hypothetical protein
LAVQKGQKISAMDFKFGRIKTEVVLVQQILGAESLHSPMPLENERILCFINDKIFS